MDVEAELDDVQQQRERGSGPATDGPGDDCQRPGYLVINPCSFTRRVALELDGMSGVVPLEGPMKA